MCKGPVSLVLDVLLLLLWNGVRLLVESGGSEGMDGGKEEEVKSTLLVSLTTPHPPQERSCPCPDPTRPVSFSKAAPCS